jgi:hypothetical protein
MKAYTRTREQAAIIARAGIRDDAIRFPLVKEGDNTSDELDGSGKFSSEVSDL